MKILIAYATKHGFTEKCAELLKDKLNGEVDLCNLKEDNPFNLEKYHTVIIGGSIYVGQIQKEIKEFCEKNLSVLKQKKIGLFLCCMRENDEAAIEMSAAFPAELLNSAAAKECFGGEFIMSKMNFFERFIVKKVAKITKDTTVFSEESFNRFVKLINNESNI